MVTTCLFYSRYKWSFDPELRRFRSRKNEAMADAIYEFTYSKGNEQQDFGLQSPQAAETSKND